MKGKGAGDDALGRGEDWRIRVSLSLEDTLCASDNLLLRSSSVVLQSRFMASPAVCDSAAARRGGRGAVAAYGWCRRRGWERVDSAIGATGTGGAAQRGQAVNERMGRSAHTSSARSVGGKVPGDDVEVVVTAVVSRDGDSAAGARRFGKEIGRAHV